MNPAHYPAAYAAAAAQHQYNQAMAAGYWSQAASNSNGAAAGSGEARNMPSCPSPSYSPEMNNGH